MTSVNREIWSDVVKEENLCETFLKLTTPTIDEDKVDNPKSSQNSRDIESYQYKSSKVSDAEINEKKRNQQKRQRNRHRRRSYPESSSSQKSKFAAVSELDSDEAVVLAIVKYLNEPKTEIIRMLKQILNYSLKGII